MNNFINMTTLEILELFHKSIFGDTSVREQMELENELIGRMCLFNVITECDRCTFKDNCSDYLPF